MKGKRIGLLTWYRGTNFGSVLQAYALQHKLIEKGRDTVVIREFDYPLSYGNVLSNIWRKAGFSIRLFHGVGIKKIRPLANCPYPEQRKKFLDFFDKEIKTVLPVGPLSLARLRRRTSVFMAGSDQLWNCYDHFRGLEFLEFAGKKRKVSYATSIGANDIPEKYHSQVKAYLSGLSHISVREKYAEEVLARITGRDDIRTVLDPTFLLTGDEWRAFASSADTSFELPEKYIFCYLLRKDHDYTATISRIKALTGVGNAVILPSSENPSLAVEGCIRYEDAGPREFVRTLCNASYVVTDSFHGSALSVNLGKQFLNLKRFEDSDPASQNNRLNCLSDLFGLGDRLFDGEIPPEIDYSRVSARLEELRRMSLEYLEKVTS